MSIETPSFAGYGLGLRPAYYAEILAHEPDVDWFEIISENYMVAGGKPLYFLDQIRERYPMVMHGVSLSIGGTAPLNQDYLQRLKALRDRVQPLWLSDHLCWTGTHAHNSHDLLPLPYTQETIRHVVGRIRQVQDFLGHRIAIENVSSYVQFETSEMPEWAFLREIAEAADCWLLLDINNVYVSAFNHAFDADTYLANVPMERVIQIHLAGHTHYGDYIIDTHDAPIASPVWELYRRTLARTRGPISTLIERDDHYPPFEEWVGELSDLRQLGRSIHAKPLARSEGSFA
ncbi:MAG: DUF692 domain-containing protein [Hahellaceae bacterium]|nr:DUF692 domain-containing protein [Hahellaceae bacterium]